MYEIIDLGVTAPLLEQSALSKSSGHGYHTRVHKEARAFIGQLRRNFGTEPYGVRFDIGRELRSSGLQLTVVCCYDPNVRSAKEYAERVDAGIPWRWDHFARSDLKIVDAVK